MAEMLSDAGYATAAFGKWHLGDEKGRYPTSQGFDEWYGIPNSMDESLWPAQQDFQELAKLAKETGKNPIDSYTGELLDTVDELKIADHTIFIFTSDNGGEFMPGYTGWSGPWSGSYFTGREGSLRVPFIIRWPGKVPAGRVSNEIVHQYDLYATLAKFAGGKIPTDRIIDSVDMSGFFLAKQEESGREGFVIYVGNDVHGAKWRNYKMLTKELEGGLGSGQLNVYPVPRFYNLYLDPREEFPITQQLAGQMWWRWGLGPIMVEHAESLAAEPPIKPGTPDPYVPRNKSN